jgi:hypothetical protein
MPMLLPALAVIGFVVPNSLLIHWLLHDYSGVANLLADKVAVAFILDVFLAMCFLAYFFARHPIGRVRWPWFVVLSLVGGLGFSIPLYWWLNQRSASPKP